MQTELLESYELQHAAELLKKGEVVAFPTETVYGLGAAIFVDDAPRKIFAAKSRPADNPLIAHVSSIAQIEMITAHLPEMFYKLYDAFFPGPLTVVLEKALCVPGVVSAGLSSIALRMPSHPIAKALIELVGQPIVAPSANTSGRPSATSYSHVIDDFEGKIAAVIRGDDSQIGIESTVISLLSDRPVLMRPGSITKEQIEKVLGCSVLSPLESDHSSAPVSPGMKYRHYAPKAPVLLFYDKAHLLSHVDDASRKKKLILASEPFVVCDMDKSMVLSQKSLYGALRLADKELFDEVLILCDDKIHGDAALMNRLIKACQTADKQP